MKNILIDKNNNSKKGEEVKIFANDKKENEKEKEKEKEKKDNRITQTFTKRNSLREININENNKEIYKIKENDNKRQNNNINNNILVNIEVDKTQLSKNKRTYLSSKVDKEIEQGQNSVKGNKIVNMPKNNNNYYKKYMCSFSVEKNKGDEKNERVIKIFTERRSNELNNNKIKTNENNKMKNDKESKVTKIDFVIQGKNINNHSISSTKNDIIIDNKNEKEKEKEKENKVQNEEKLKKDNSNLECSIKNRKRNGIATPNLENTKKEENKNTEITSFGSTVRKSMYNPNVYNINTANISKKNNSNIVEIQKENINNSLINNNSNKDKDTKKDNNNLKTLINSTHKNVYRNNHNYIAITSSGPKKINNINQIKTNKPEKQEKVNDNKKINNQENNNFTYEKNPFSVSTINKNEQKQNYRDSNRRLTNDINNYNINSNTSNNSNNNNQNNNIIPTNNINNNNYHVLRATSVKSVDTNIPNNNDLLFKRKTVVGQANNHSMKMSYGINTFKVPNEKKENEVKINNNKNNEENYITNYANNKNGINNSNNINNNIVNISSNNNNNNNENKSSFINNDKNRRDTRAKNNHSLYVSISSKK